MKKQKLMRVHPGKVVPKQKREEEQPILARQHPLIELQGIIGNRGVQRLLVQRETVQLEASGEDETSDARAERYIRDQIAQQDKWITRTFEIIEMNLFPDERERRLPMVQNVKNIHVTTGVLSLKMIEILQKAIQPVRNVDYINSLFERLQKDVEIKEDMLQGLKDDPYEWYNKYMNKLLRL